jgi:hypothetical protein
LEWSLALVQAHGDVTENQHLQCPTQLWQVLRLRDQIVLEALSAEPLTFLEYDSADGILPSVASSLPHAHVELITGHAYGRRVRTPAGFRQLSPLRYTGRGRD